MNYETLQFLCIQFFRASDRIEIVDERHICSETIELEIKLIKVNETVDKLSSKCCEKAKEIARIRAAEKRAKISISNMQQILNQFKDDKIISNEGHEKLYNVIS